MMNEEIVALEKDKAKEAVPITLLNPGFINDTPYYNTMRALLDSGASLTCVHKRCLPQEVIPYEVRECNIQGFGGTRSITQMVDLRRVILPEFSKSFMIEKINAYVVDIDTKHDIIVGRDVLHPAGFKMDFDNNKVEWMDMIISMKETPTSEVHLIDYVSDLESPEGYRDDQFTVEIKSSKYEEVSPSDVVTQQEHLLETQKNVLRKLLNKYPELFNGKLKEYRGSKVHLTLKKDHVATQSRPYRIPFVHRELFKEELGKLIKQGVLEKAERSVWSTPTFLIPKKDGRVRWISDFRVLNSNLQRKQYELPRIRDILERRKGYKFFTKLDISMQYYTFGLDEESKSLCTITTPFGLYRYNRLPMGISEAPDIAQEIMESTLSECDCEVYIDDIGVFGETWDSHVEELDKVLDTLQRKGFTINPLKCEWCVKETDWLGHWLTPVGIKPWRKKVQAILAMKPPTTMKQLKSFLGAVNFYKDMWQRRAHIQAPLTDLLGKKEFKWSDIHQKAFKTMKAIMTKDVLLYYPDHNKTFHVFTDSSDYQLGSTIGQKDDNGILRPVMYFSKKLNGAQKNYPTGEKEFLSIYETLKTFRTMLLGADIQIYTDHQNLTYKKINSQRMLRWRMYIEEYGPILHFIEGEMNTCADYFSRMELDDEIMKEKEGPSVRVDQEDSLFQDLIYDDCLMAEHLDYECFINIPVGTVYPMSYRSIRHSQAQCGQLKQLRLSNPNEYRMEKVTNEIELIYHNNKIFIPLDLARSILEWYHNALNHIGEEKMYQTYSQHFYTKNVRHIIKEICSQCHVCQVNKISTINYGLLPPRQVSMNPWHTVAVDLVGPWKIKVEGMELEYHALTVIDNDTNLTEAVRIRDKTSKHIASKFEDTWLSRYPRPLKCIHDRGSEFTGQEFQELLKRFDIQSSQSTTKNPQSNAIVERMHQSMGNQLRSLLRQHPPTSREQAVEAIDSMLASVVYALRVGVHSVLDMAPGAIAFHRDMVMNLPLVVDLNGLRNKRQLIVDRNNVRENMKRIDYHYKVGQWILIRKDTYKTLGKMEERYVGPYLITEVHVNGTLTIRKRPNVLERVNIRRVKPYHGSKDS